MSKLHKDKYKVVESMTRYETDLNKTSVEDFINGMLEYIIPFLQKYNTNITKLESLTKEEQDAIFENWDTANMELCKILLNIKKDGDDISG